jgi:hypothetical protein
MKEVTGKICHRNNVSPVHAEKNGSNGNTFNINIFKREPESNSHSPQNAKKLTPSKFSKF